jgi:tRNA wybutosine-synthesizing protein 3
LTASTDHAQRVLTAALNAGFRESGAVSLSTAKSRDSTPIVAVRSTGYSFDCFIGYQDGNGRNVCLVGEKYLQSMVAIANDRFRINTERIARFHKALVNMHQQLGLHRIMPNNPEWEDANSRRLRKREEGLARQHALKAQETRQRPDDISPSEGVSNNDMSLR